MQFYNADRRSSHRLQFKTALRVRIWKSGSGEQRAESENLSERGTFFATDAPLAIGSPVEILLKMPQEITGKPATEWKCTGHVVRLEPRDSPRGKLGVGVQFDCYEILRSQVPPLPESI
jgi:PilZ domain